MSRTLKQLQDEVVNLGYQLPSEKGKNPLLKVLEKHFLSKKSHVSWGLQQRLKFQNPGLCFSYKHLKPNEQQRIWDSSDWVVEKKLNGCRMLAFYHPEEGFTFFSRNISDQDYLPVDYTDHMLLIKDGIARKPADFVGEFKKAFIIDCEVIAEGLIDTSIYRKTGVQTGTQLNATTALLSIEAETSHQIQLTQSALKLFAFDVLYFDDKFLFKRPLKDRYVYLDKMIPRLSQMMNIERNRPIYREKYEFYQNLIKEGEEGVVAKRLSAEYVPTSSRRRDIWVKCKRTMSESLGTDLDMFITGFVPAKQDKSWSNYIGALKMSVFLRDKDGNEKEHWMATVAGLPMDLRQKMTEIVKGEPVLKKEYYGQVLVINGQSVTSKSLRLAHAVADSWQFRTDKSKFDCIIEKEFLESQVL